MTKIRLVKYFHGKGGDVTRARDRGKNLGAVALFVSSLGLGAMMSWALSSEGEKSSQKDSAGVKAKENKRKKVKPRPWRLDLPTFTASEVAEHNAKAKTVWVHLHNGVYDVTKYAKKHPGGDRILMAGGKNLQPFWDLYPVHNDSEVLEMMEEKMRVGNIQESQSPDIRVIDLNDPFLHEPKRSKVLQTILSNPYNAETPSQLLTERTETPNGLFFVCNHKPVPKVNLEDYTLKLELSDDTVTLTFDDLKTNFPKTELTATIQCVKNRSKEMSELKETKGPKWGHGAVSTARWAGVSLDDLLKGQGLDIEKIRGKHVVFEGLDIQDDGLPYGASIPMELARSLKKEILIAYEMNGAQLPRDHGFPVRVVVPGVAGARHVKWLGQISFSSQESQSVFQQQVFKVSNSTAEMNGDDLEKSGAITQLPVTSAICEPVEGSVITENLGALTVRGYAFSGSGLGVARVDVSADGGVTWVDAVLRTNQQPPHRTWAWTLWDAYVPVSPGQAELVVKAVDAAHNVQPDRVAALWNQAGVLNTAWHRVKVTVVPAKGQGSTPAKRNTEEPQLIEEA